MAKLVWPLMARKRQADLDVIERRMALLQERRNRCSEMLAALLSYQDDADSGFSARHANRPLNPLVVAGSRSFYSRVQKGIDDQRQELASLDRLLEQARQEALVCLRDIKKYDKLVEIEQRKLERLELRREAKLLDEFNCTAASRQED